MARFARTPNEEKGKLFVEKIHDRNNLVKTASQHNIVCIPSLFLIYKVNIHKTNGIKKIYKAKNV